MALLNSRIRAAWKLKDQYSGNIPVHQVLTILQQSLSALAYLHGRNPPIAHRDIKPGNILVQSLESAVY